MQASGQDGYTTSTGVPPSTGGDLPHTGADLGPIAGLGAGLLFLGVALWAGLGHVRRTATPTPVQAPDYLRNKAPGGTHVD